MVWLRALNCSFLSINVRVDVETNLETHRKFWISLYLIFGDVCKNWYYVFLAIVLCVRLPRRNLECFSSKHEVALESEMWKKLKFEILQIQIFELFPDFWISCLLFFKKIHFDKKIFYGIFEFLRQNLKIFLNISTKKSLKNWIFRLKTQDFEEKLEKFKID